MAEFHWISNDDKDEQLKQRDQRDRKLFAKICDQKALKRCIKDDRSAETSPEISVVRHFALHQTL